MPLVASARVVAGALVGSLLLARGAAPLAHADPRRLMMDDTYYEVGPIQYHGGYTFADGSAGLSGSGVHLYERNGWGGRLVAAVAVGFALALGQSGDSKYVGSETGFDANGEYRIDYYQRKTEEDRAAERKATSDAMSGIANNDFQMDLELFPESNGNEKGHGFAWVYYPFSINLIRGVKIETGIQWIRLTGRVGPVDAMGLAAERTFRNFGMPFKLIVPLTPYAFGEAELQWNWLAGEAPTADVDHSSSVRAMFTVNPIERVFVRGGIQSNHMFDPTKYGYVIEGGVRF